LDSINIDEEKEKLLLKYSSKISALFIIIAVFGFAILMFPFAFSNKNPENEIKSIVNEFFKPKPYLERDDEIIDIAAEPI
jgi:hypothetical protein